MHDDALEPLFLRFRDHDDCAAFVRFHVLAAPLLQRTARRLLRDRAVVDDAVQNTFLAVLRHAGSWDARRPLRPWLLAILRNELRDAARSRRRRATRPLDPDLAATSADPQAMAIHGERRRSLFAAMNALPPGQQRLAWLHLQTDGDLDATAALVGGSTASVRSQLARIRARLAALLPPGLALWLLLRPAVAAPRSTTARRLAGLTFAVAVTACLTWSLATHPEPAAAPTTTGPADAGPGTVAATTIGPAAREALRPAPDPTPPTSRWQALVVDADGRPMPGVTLRIRPTTGDDPILAERWLVTDAAGLVDGPAMPGTVLVLPDRAPGALLPGTASPVPHRLQCPRGFELVGTVVEDGIRVANATVWLSEDDNDSDGVDLVRTDAEGTFCIREVSGRRFLSARTGSRRSAAIEVGGAPGSRHVVEVALTRPAATVHGQVFGPTGAPQPHALVRAGAAPFGRFGNPTPPVLARCDADGHFQILGAPVGRVPLTASAPALATATRTVTLAAGELAQGDLVLSVGAGITGRITDHAGQPIAGAWVGPLHGFRERLLGTFTDTDGHYLMRGAPPRCTLWVDAGDRGGASVSWRDLRAGEVRCWDAALTMLRSSWPLTLTDRGGTPLAGWTIEGCATTLSAADPGHRRRGATDAAGQVVLPACVPGPWALVVRAPGSPFSDDRIVDASPGNGVLHLVADPTRWSHSLRAVVTHAAASPRVQAVLWRTDRLERQVLAIAGDGSLQADNLPPGGYGLTVQIDGRDVWVRDDLGLAGGSIEITVDLSAHR